MPAKYNIMQYVVPKRRRKTTRRVYRRRRPYTRRRFGRRKNGPTYVRMPRAISDKLFTKFSYVDTYVVNASSATIACPFVYQSSIFSPRNGGGAHQPLWMDQYMPSLFTSYRVFGVKYAWIAVNKSVNDSFWAGVRCANTNIPDTQLQVAMERGDGKWRMGGSVNGGASRIIISGYMSVAKVRGESPSVVRNDDDYRGTISSTTTGTNPPVMAFIHPMLATTYSGGGTVAFDCTLRLTFYCELGDRSSPGSS